MFWSGSARFCWCRAQEHRDAGSLLQCNVVTWRSNVIERLRHVGKEAQTYMRVYAYLHKCDGLEAQGPVDSEI